MAVLIASDIHGSALYCEQLLDLMKKEKMEDLILLGDILYHGPAMIYRKVMRLKKWLQC